MGIKGYLQWIQEEFPSAFVKPRTQYDGVFFDMNGIVHNAGRRGKDEGHVFVRTFQEIDHVMRQSCPQRRVMLAVDGPAPLAKVQTQKARRVQKGKSQQEKKRAFDSLAITTGTEFMSRLEDALYYLACARLQTNRKLSRVEFIVSGPCVPGEGEVKISRQLLRDVLVADSRAYHLIVGADSDLLLLGMSTGIQNLHIMMKRERQEYCFSNEEMFRALAQKFPHADVIRLRVDFVVISFMNGNDYIPKIRGASMKRLWRQYCKMQQRNRAEAEGDWYLVRSDLTFNAKFLAELMSSTVYVPSDGANRMDASDAESAEETEDEEEEEEEEVESDGENGSESEAATETTVDDGVLDPMAEDQEHEHGRKHSHSSAHDDAAMAHKRRRTQDGTGLDHDEGDEEIEGEVIVFGQDQPEARETITMMSVGPLPAPAPAAAAAPHADDIESRVQAEQRKRRWREPDPVNYLKALLWCLRMYHDGQCPDYEYLYPHQWAPDGQAIRALDAKAIEGVAVDPVPDTQPALPVECALMILPPSAADHLPAPIRNLVRNSPELQGMMNSQDIMDKTRLRAIVDSTADEWREEDDQRGRTFGRDLSVQRSFGPHAHFIPPTIPSGKMRPLLVPYNLATRVLDEGTNADAGMHAASATGAAGARRPAPASAQHPHHRQPAHGQNHHNQRQHPRERIDHNQTRGRRAPPPRADDSHDRQRPRGYGRHEGPPSALLGSDYGRQPRQWAQTGGANSAGLLQHPPQHHPAASYDNRQQQQPQYYQAPAAATDRYAHHRQPNPYLASGKPATAQGAGLLGAPPQQQPVGAPAPYYQPQQPGAAGILHNPYLPQHGAPSGSTGYASGGSHASYGAGHGGASMATDAAGAAAAAARYVSGQRRNDSRDGQQPPRYPHHQHQQQQSHQNSHIRFGDGAGGRW